MKFMKLAVCCFLSLSILTSCAPEKDVAQAGQEAPPMSEMSSAPVTASIEEALPPGEPDQTETSSTAPTSSVVESSSASQTDTRQEVASQALPQAQEAYAEITCYLDSAGNTQTQRITDPSNIQEIERLFTGLEESGVTLMPNTGGRFFIITIAKNGTQSSYRLARDRDADDNYYCKYASTDSAASTGWLKLPDPSAYQYFSGFFESAEAPLGSPENPYAEEPQAEPEPEAPNSETQWKYDGQPLPDDEPWEPQS